MRRLTFLTVFVVSAISAWLVQVSQASAYPPVTRSYFEYNASPQTLYNQGCASGSSQADGVKMLDFGRPAQVGGSYGTMDFGGHFDSDQTIVQASESYAKGYKACLPQGSTARISLAIATNNSCSPQDPNCPSKPTTQPASFGEAGRVWARSVGDLDGYLHATGLSTNVRASGGDDAEPAWDPKYSNTYDFVKGFADATGYSHPFWDFGSLEPGYWSPAQEYYVTWGAKPSVPFGQIFYPSMAKEWEDLNLWAVNNTGHPMHIYGVTTQSNPPAKCGYTPQGGYDAMLSQLQSHKSTYQSYIDYLTNFPC